MVVKHLSLNHVCKIGLKENNFFLYILFSLIISNNQYMHVSADPEPDLRTKNAYI
jgi:hypothetical protein